MKKSKIMLDYSWIIVFISALMVFTVIGFCSSARSVYVVPICEALGISRSTFSISDSCRFITTAVVNIFFGALIARFGAKKLILAGFISLIISMLIYSYSTNIYGFYIGSVFLGIGYSWTTTTMVGAIVNSWCKRNRGIIMGFILASNGVGGSLAMQILTPIIYEEGNPFGYRNSYKLVMLILLVVAVIMLIFFKDHPNEEAENEDVQVKQQEKSDDGLKRPYIFSKSYFYVAVVCIFFTGMILQGMSGIAAAHLKDVGINISYVSIVLSIDSLLLTFSKFSVGFIYDRFGIKKTSAICFIASFVALSLLLLSGPSTAGKVAAMGYGIFCSFALPLETVMLPLYTRELAGEHNFNKMLGIVASVNTAGYAIGGPTANLCFDITGNYNIYIYICGAIILVAAFLMQGALTKAHKDFN